MCLTHNKYISPRTPLPCAMPRAEGSAACKAWTALSEVTWASWHHLGICLSEVSCSISVPQAGCSSAAGSELCSTGWVCELCIHSSTNMQATVDNNKRLAHTETKATKTCSPPPATPFSQPQSESRSLRFLLHSMMPPTFAPGTPATSASEPP